LKLLHFLTHEISDFVTGGIDYLVSLHSRQYIVGINKESVVLRIIS
jgi:hypothetical protein